MIYLTNVPDALRVDTSTASREQMVKLWLLELLLQLVSALRLSIQAPSRKTPLMSAPTCTPTSNMLSQCAINPNQFVVQSKQWNSPKMERPRRLLCQNWQLKVNRAPIKLRAHVVLQVSLCQVTPPSIPKKFKLPSWSSRLPKSTLIPPRVPHPLTKRLARRKLTLLLVTQLLLILRTRANTLTKKHHQEKMRMVPTLTARKSSLQQMKQNLPLMIQSLYPPNLQQIKLVLLQTPQPIQRLIQKP